MLSLAYNIYVPPNSHCSNESKKSKYFLDMLTIHNFQQGNFQTTCSANFSFAFGCEKQLKGLLESMGSSTTKVVIKRRPGTVDSDEDDNDDDLL